jgi:hypothetical protein
LQVAPECRIEDISNVQAVRLLVPQILATQSKGYNLVAIAAMRADKGIAVTAPAPKSYLNLAKEGTGPEVKKPPGSTHGHVPDLPADLSRPVTSIEAEALHTPDALPRATNSKNECEATAAPKPTSPSAWPPVVPPAPDKVVAPRVREGPPRRSAITPSRDSEDI